MTPPVVLLTRAWWLSSRGTRLGDRPGHGDVLLGDRRFGRGRHIEPGFNVHNHGTHGQRDTAGRNYPTQDLVNQDEFITGRICVGQGADVHVAGQLGSDQIDDVGVLALDTNDALFGAHQIDRGRQPVDHRVGMISQDLDVLVQKRFALGGVNQHGIGLGGQLHVSWKSGAAGAHHARLRHVIN